MTLLRPVALLLLLAVPLTAFTCTSTLEEVYRSDLFVPGGLPDTEWTARRDSYLQHATAVAAPGSVMNVVAHLTRAELDPTFSVPNGFVGPTQWDGLFTKIATLRDTSDFDVMRFLWLWYDHGGHPAVDASVWARIQQTFLDFKYWFSDPTPAGLSDDMWYWTENHQIIFHVAEYLAGQAFPNEVFRVTGLTGAQHRARAEPLIREWMDYRSRYGFSEFHSHVYYEEDLFPLLTFVEFADDPALVERAKTLVDVLLFDVARHQFRGSFAGTHGRTYKKDKTDARRQDTFTTTKMLFDTAERPYDSVGATSTTMLCASQRYRVPEIVVRAGRFAGTTVDRERMGIYFDENEPIVPGVAPVHPHGISYTDPASIAPWWGMSNLTAWQVLPMTLGIMESYGLWDTQLFQPYSVLRPFATSGQYGLVQSLAQYLAPAVSMANLSEVNSYWYRTPDYQLASSQSYRPGHRSNQGHAWTAVLPGDALVFTTHPGAAATVTSDWNSDESDPGFWTGSASLPRSGQYRNVGIHLYAPAYDSTTSFGLGAFTRMLRYTHAFFPQDRFDEVVQIGNWTFGRKAQSYLALWSWITPQFVPTPAGVATDGMTLPFELRAEIPAGAPNNVWIVELGSESEWGSFAAFQSAIVAAPITVTRTTAGQLPLGLTVGQAFDVVYGSPSQGTIEYGWASPLRVNGAVEPTSDYGRYDNRWAQSPFGASEHALFDDATKSGLYLDTQRGIRIPVRAR